MLVLEGELALLPEKLTCKEASRIISSGLDRDLSATQRAALRYHLVVCDACSQLKAQFEFLRKALATLAGRHGDQDEPPRS
jgi:anti-sigma factor RsiW